jgi:hypothetical protein
LILVIAQYSLNKKWSKGITFTMRPTPFVKL